MTNTYCVNRFAEIMISKLNENNHKSGWKNCTNSYLLKRLREEVDELEKALINGKGHFEIGREAADVANFAMMVAFNVCALS